MGAAVAQPGRAPDSYGPTRCPRSRDRGPGRSGGPGFKSRRRHHDGLSQAPYKVFDSNETIKILLLPGRDNDTIWCSRTWGYLEGRRSGRRKRREMKERLPGTGRVLTPASHVALTVPVDLPRRIADYSISPAHVPGHVRGIVDSPDVYCKA